MPDLCLSPSLGGSRGKDLYTVRRCTTLPLVTRRPTAFRIDDELLEGLRHVHAKDGVLPSEQVRRAIRQWLSERGVQVRRPTDVLDARPQA